MFKRVVKFCKETVCAAPVFFLLNTLFLLAMVFLRLGMSYTFKYLTDLLCAVMNTVVVSVSISVFSPLIFLYIAVISVCMSWVNIHAAKRRVSLNDSYVNKERSAAYYDKLFIDKGAAREIRIFRLKDHLLSLWKEKYDGVYYDKYQLETKLNTLSYLPNILQNAFSYLLLVSFAYWVYTGSLSLGEFVFLFNVMWALTGSLTSIIKILSGTIFEKDKYVERYERFVAGESDGHEEANDHNDANGHKEANSHNEANGHEDANMHEESGNRAGAFSDFALEHVSYRYENQQRAAVENVCKREDIPVVSVPLPDGGVSGICIPGVIGGNY